MFGRLKDFRRIATRHDKLAANFPAAVQLAASVCYCLWVWSGGITVQTQPLAGSGGGAEGNRLRQSPQALSL
jgi:hypothetical protein